MVTDPAAQWAFTVVFGALALYSLYRIVADRTRPLQAVGQGFHVVMAADMIAMPWAWWAAIPAGLQIVVFSAGAAWFLVLLVLQVRRVISRRMLGGHGPWHQVAHAVMMIAMVWMVAAMAPMVGTSQSDPMPTSGHSHAALSGTSAAIGIAATAALLIIAVVLVVEFIDCVRGPARTWRGHTGDVASGAVMSFGMAAMCWLMLAA
ncbi:DUF5134 domain-containing protein [uncultured Microbacterium sp.]|uniref:DUF5134 domain-containing protein n=1 Tax=uncultured Microbacterium sp. TaxID=191216 RepID=UPI0035C9EB8B